MTSIHKIEDEERLTFLPSFFGHDFLRFENAMYDTAHDQWEEYNGGGWDFYIVTDEEGNKAPLMIWDTDAESVHVTVPTNFTDMNTTPKAASVALMQTLINHLGWLWHRKGDDEKSKRYFTYYETLREWGFTTTDLSDDEARDIAMITD